MKPHRSIQAFTLLELMVVVAIMGIILVMGIPAIREATHREALTQATRDITEGCKDARARAILSGKPAELRISPKDGHIEVGDASYAATDTPPDAGVAVAADDTAGNVRKPAAYSAQLSDQIGIEMLDINFVESKDDEIARVRFYSNGTSDEFFMVLKSDSGERRQITLEVVTALPDWGPFEGVRQ